MNPTNNEEKKDNIENNPYASAWDKENTTPTTNEETPVVQQPVNTTPIVEQSQVTPIQQSTQQQVVEEPKVTPEVLNSQIQTEEKGTDIPVTPIKEEIPYTPIKKWKVVLLIIFFTCVLGYIWFLPEIGVMIEDWKSEQNLNKKQQTPISTPTPTATTKPSPTVTTTPNKENLKTITCEVKPTELTETTSLGGKMIYYHENNKLKKIDIYMSTIYKTKDSFYNTAVTNCNTENPNLKNHSGYDASCEVNDLTINSIQKFDLNNFENFSYENNGVTEEISLDAKLDEDVNKFISQAKAEGYTCK